MKLSSLPIAAAVLAGSTRAFDCTPSALAAVLPANASAIFAHAVAANGTFGEAGDIAYPTNATNLPALCAVAVNVTTSPVSSFTFGLFLPAAATWNGRFLAVGNGGFNGGINWLDMGAGAQYGFAVVSTNTGHNSTNAVSTWALANAERKADWGHRAMHGSVVLAKALVAAFYAAPPQYAYYSGCSTGGFQGLQEVQRHPDDFDGVLAGAPAWWHSHLQTWSIWVGAHNSPVNASHHIPPALFPVIAAEVRRQCDGADGLADGIVSDPRACDFFTEALLCTPRTANASACLTAPQIATLGKIHADWVDANQTFVFPRLELGTESQWTLVNESGADALSVGYVQNFVLDDPTWTWQQLDYATVAKAAAVNPGATDADNYNLTAFRERGGKLLHYHGYADGLIPTHSSVYYYKHVLSTLAPAGIDVDDFYRFFLVPGMGHCSGTAMDAPWYIAGANQAAVFSNGTYSVPGHEDPEHDALMALMRWVEEGVAPDKIVATKFENDKPEDGVLRQRPLCPFPAKAVFKGNGSSDDAVNWACQ